MMPIGMVTPKSTGKKVRKSTRKNSDYSSSGAISSASDISVRVDELDKKLTQMAELM